MNQGKELILHFVVTMTCFLR